MADPGARVIALRGVRGGLWDAIRRRSDAARASGALAPVGTDTITAQEGGIPFAIRVARTPMQRKARGEADVRNPFLPPDPELLVGAIGESHWCVLNKYPVIQHHALIVTRDFEDQAAPLTRRDFEALWTCLLGGGGLAFYNSTPIAGASQRHRHLQLVPTPLTASPLATPLDAVEGSAHFDGRIGRIEVLPFLHGLGRLRSVASQPPGDAAAALHALYQELARAFGCQRHGQPYNLLVCREWMLLVPRARANWRGVGVNALGFAGALAVAGREELEIVRREGPLGVLARVAVPLAVG